MSDERDDHETDRADDSGHGPNADAAPVREPPLRRRQAAAPRDRQDHPRRNR